MNREQVEQIRESANATTGPLRKVQQENGKFTLMAPDSDFTVVFMQIEDERAANFHANARESIVALCNALLACAEYQPQPAQVAAQDRIPDIGLESSGSILP
jgi:hypothetical protein